MSKLKVISRAKKEALRSNPFSMPGEELINRKLYSEKETVQRLLLETNLEMNDYRFIPFKPTIRCRT
jgi:hypothetical protein